MQLYVIREKEKGEGSKNLTAPKFLLSWPCRIPQEPPLQNTFRSACCSPNADGNKSPTRHRHHWVAEKGSSERGWKLQSIQNTSDFSCYQFYSPPPQFIKYFKVTKQGAGWRKGNLEGELRQASWPGIYDNPVGKGVKCIYKITVIMWWA